MSASTTTVLVLVSPLYEGRIEMDSKKPTVVINRNLGTKKSLGLYTKGIKERRQLIKSSESP